MDTNTIINDKASSGVGSARSRGFARISTALAVGTVVLAACGGTSDTRAVEPVPETQSVSAFLSDPGPAHQPDYGLLAEIVRPEVTAAAVEFGGLSAPVGEPNWRALSVQPPAVEFGGMPAPIGWPNWDALPAAVSPVEFGGLPAPMGEPNWGAPSVQPLPIEFGGMPAPIGEPMPMTPTVPDHQRNGGPR